LQRRIGQEKLLGCFLFILLFRGLSIKLDRCPRSRCT
jgi:hypothetical protein